IDHYQREPSSRQRARHDSLEASGRLNGDQLRRQRPQPFDQFFQAFAVARNRKGHTAWTEMNIQPVLRHVNTNVDRLHLNPSLRNRARGAPFALVRARGNGGRSPMLSSGLQSPRLRRSPARHGAFESASPPRADMEPTMRAVRDAPHPDIQQTKTPAQW